MDDQEAEHWSGVRSHADPASLTIEMRFEEIALILARGVLRLKKRHLSPEILAASPPERLDVSAETVLSGG